MAKALRLNTPIEISEQEKTYLVYIIRVDTDEEYTINDRDGKTVYSHSGKIPHFFKIGCSYDMRYHTLSWKLLDIDDVVLNRLVHVPEAWDSSRRDKAAMWMHYIGSIHNVEEKK